MNLIILAAVITFTSAAQLPSRNYIPQGQGQSGHSQGSGGFGGSEGFGVSQGGGSGQYQGSQTGGFGGSGGFDSGNIRSQQAQEKNAAILKQDQTINEDGSYHYGYETENGIRAEEAGNTVEAQGGFSYKGDDGHTYTVTYTSGEGGFRPQGEHLPVAPPTPEAILEALQKNAQDEAAGIFDDGIYRPDAHGGPGGNRPGLAGGHFGSGSRPGQGGQPSFGGKGSHQNGFNSNSGYTY